MRASDHNKAVRQIIATLKGPVADVFRRLVPSLADLSGPQFYETVLSSPDLLHGCLLVFRKQRDAFAEVLVDAQGRLVNDDFVPLRCGRSVHDVTAMIVRTHAKRHFRAALGGDPNDPRSGAGRLYAALNDYLIHEWQLPLIQHYAPLAIGTVRELGPRIMDYKSPEALKALAGETSLQPPPIQAPAPVASLAPERAGAEENARERDFWWESLNDPLVRAAMGAMADAEMRELTAAFCQLGEATRGNLLAPLGLSLYQAAVLLGTCHRVLGRAAFTQTFGKPGNATAVAAFTAALQRKGIGSRTQLRPLEQAAHSVLATLPRTNTRRAMAAAQ